MSTLLAEACEWATSLTVAGVPDDVRRLAIAQAMSAAAARRATRRHPVALRLATPRGGVGWADQAAGDALLTMALDFDETAFAGHLGHAVTAVAMRAGAETGADGDRVLVAMVAAAEVAARLTASVTLGPARGQTASHTHAAGAVVAAGVVMGVSAGELGTALSLALSQPRQVLLPAFMGSDAKFWVAAAPILDAARALEEARRGARALASVLEAPRGVLDSLADVPLPQAFSGYGERWHLRTLSIKAVPGCAYLGAAVEAAAALGPVPLEEVDGVEVDASIFTVGMEAESSSFVDGPATPTPALSFTTGYNLAAALETGGLEVEDLHGERLRRPERWRVAGACRLGHEEELTVAALAGTAPIGAALAWAGDAALPYLARRGAGEALARRVLARAASENDPAFSRVSKRIGARVRVRLRDGRALDNFRDAARGSCQETVEARCALAADKLRAQDRGDGELLERVVAAYEGMAELDAGGLRWLAGADGGGSGSGGRGEPQAGE